MARRRIADIAGMQVLFAMISVLIVFLQCSPTEKLWDPSTPGTCWDPAVFNDFSYWVSAYTTMTDIVLAVMPISAFWNLQMRFSRKLSVCVMMGLTLLSAVVTIVKATYLHLFTDKVDPLWNVVPLVLWGLVEQNVVIIAACIPTIHPLFRRVFRPEGYTSSNTDNSSHSRSGFNLTFKLSSNAKHTSKRLPSESELELPLNERHQQRSDYAESNDTQKGIWQTREVRVESDEERDESSIDRNFREVVPANLRARE